MARKFQVTGHSGQTEVIEAENYIAANKQFVEHHGEPVFGTVEVHEAIIVEEDTARG